MGRHLSCGVLEMRPVALAYSIRIRQLATAVLLSVLTPLNSFQLLHYFLLVTVLFI
jgi:predicted membrane chloride channel (bestrophin family)